MAEAKKTDPTELGLSSDEIRAHYPEFSRSLAHRREEVARLQQEARAQLDEQVISSPGDDADISVLDTSADYFLKLANHHQEELLEIRDAFDRMDRGVYGICENCAEPIALERLRRLPFARLCVDCQHSSERGQLTITPNPYPKL